MWLLGMGYVCRVMWTPRKRWCGFLPGKIVTPDWWSDLLLIVHNYLCGFLYRIWMFWINYKATIYLFIGNRPHGSGIRELWMTHKLEIKTHGSVSCGPRKWGVRKREWVYISSRKLISARWRHWIHGRPHGLQALVSSCCAKGCKNRFGSYKGLGFFRVLSTQTDWGCKWVVAIKKKAWRPKKHDRICGDHFISGKFTTFMSIEIIKWQCSSLLQLYL